MSGNVEGTTHLAKRPKSIVFGIPRLRACPSGWSRRKFGEILRVVERRAVVKEDTQYQLVNAKRSRGGIVAREMVLGRELKTKEQYSLRAGDFVVANRQIIHGGCGVVPASLDGALVSGEYTVLHPQNGLRLDWFTHFTHTSYFQQTCFHSSIGVDVEKMVFKLRWWLSHELNVPPESEQERIAEVVSAWEKATEAIRTLADAKRRRKLGLARELLRGKKRMPGSMATWEWQTLGDMVAVNPETLSESTDSNRAFRYIELSSVDGGRVQLPDEVVRFGDAPSRARRLLRTGDVLVATVRPSLRGYGFVDFDASDCVASTGFAVLRAKPGNDAGFIYQLLYDDEVQRQFHSRVAGSSYPALSEEDLLSVRVMVPNLREQHEIAAVLQTADAEIAAEEKRLEALEEQKMALLQKLLTGEVRVRT